VLHPIVCCGGCRTGCLAPAGRSVSPAVFCGSPSTRPGVRDREASSSRISARGLVVSPAQVARIAGYARRTWWLASRCLLCSASTSNGSLVKRHYGFSEVAQDLLVRSRFPEFGRPGLCGRLRRRHADLLRGGARIPARTHRASCYQNGTGAGDGCDCAAANGRGRPRSGPPGSREDWCNRSGAQPRPAPGGYALRATSSRGSACCFAAILRSLRLLPELRKRSM
jgi:hypothetical protein